MKPNSLNPLLTVLMLLCTWACKQQKTDEKTTEVSVKPNIVVIYLDDLGYGDVSAYGATEISTPNMDKIANGGVRFTNGYASSATCTPS
ncbi:sulfatase-like hydrolase/transferase, partial [Echinicola sediminis]